MAYSVEFREAVAYSLSCVHLQSFTLKDKQEEALFHLYSGRDVFTWFSTGYGKSICYQLLPFMFDFKLKRTTAPQAKRSSVLVISPLVSLMVDQVSGLQKRGVNAAILSGNTGILSYIGIASQGRTLLFQARVLADSVKLAPMFAIVCKACLCAHCGDQGRLCPLPPWVFKNLPEVSWCTRLGWRVASWNCSLRASSAYLVFLCMEVKHTQLPTSDDTVY